MQRREAKEIKSVIRKIRCPVNVRTMVPQEVYLLYKVPEEDGLLSQGIMNEAFRKEDHPVGKIVL